MLMRVCTLAAQSWLVASHRYHSDGVRVTMPPEAYVINSALLINILSDQTGEHANAEIEDGVRVGHLNSVWRALHGKDASLMEAFWSGDRGLQRDLR